MKDAKVRLFVDHSLDRGQSAALSRDQAHYIFGVMRRSAGDDVAVLNGRDGEWRAENMGAGAALVALRIWQKALGDWK